MREECSRFAEQLTGLFSEIVFKTTTGELLRELEERDVTLSQLQALTWIAEHPGCSIGAIAAGLGVSHPAAVKLAQRLQEKQLVGRSVAASDHRQAAVSVTRAGLALVNRVRAARTERLCRVLDRMRPEDRLALIRGLEAFVTATRGERALDGLCCRCQALLPTDCEDFVAVRERLGR